MPTSILLKKTGEAGADELGTASLCVGEIYADFVFWHNMQFQIKMPARSSQRKMFQAVNMRSVLTKFNQYSQKWGLFFNRKYVLKKYLNENNIISDKNILLMMFPLKL